MVARYWLGHRSVAIRAEPVLAHGNTAVLRIGRRGPDIPPPHPEENYHLHPNENFRIENQQLHFTTTKRGLDKHPYTDNTINRQTGSRYKQIEYTAIRLDCKHVLDKYERIEYIDNTINIQTDTVNLH